jgi:hypothetical protein
LTTKKKHEEEEGSDYIRRSIHVGKTESREKKWASGLGAFVVVPATRRAKEAGGP